MSGPRSHTVRIGDYSTTVLLCAVDSCRSAAGPSGTCWAHSGEEVEP